VCDREGEEGTEGIYMLRMVYVRVNENVSHLKRVYTTSSNGDNDYRPVQRAIVKVKVKAILIKILKVNRRTSKQF
jgi:hypothetical protein